MEHGYSPYVEIMIMNIIYMSFFWNKNMISKGVLDINTDQFHLKLISNAQRLVQIKC